MATTKMWAVKGAVVSAGMVIKKVVEYVSNDKKTGKDGWIERDTETDLTSAVSNVITYSMKAEKTEEEKYVTAINCTKDHAIEEMISTKRRWHERGNRLLWHGYQSFNPGEVTPEAAHEIGIKLARELYSDRFEIVVATHVDRAHIHNHFVINSVSFLDGKKLDWDTYYPKMREVSDRLCKENRLSTVETDELSGHYPRGVIRAKEEGRATLDSIMAEDIDCCIAVASGFDNFIDLMKAKGYRLDMSGKYLSVTPPGRKKAIRIDRRRGDSYSVEGIKERIRDKEMTDNASYQGVEISSLSDMEKEYTVPEVTGPEFKVLDLKEGTSTSGYQACYLRYMNLMGVFPERSSLNIAKSHYYFREDLIKLDKYINESRMMIDNGISTEEDLKNYKEKRIRDLGFKEKEREKLRGKVRRCKDEGTKENLKSDVKEMNQEIKRIKKDLFYCNDIKKTTDEIKRKVSDVYGFSEKKSGREMEIDG